LLHPGLQDWLLYGAAMDTTNSITSASRYTHASTPIPDGSSSVLWVTAIVELLVLILRQPQLFKNMAAVHFFFRSDRGEEVFLLADAFVLHKKKGYIQK
jgi:hypothetical protein